MKFLAASGALIATLLRGAVSSEAAVAAESTMGETVDDAVVTPQVKAALGGDSTTKPRKIDVETHLGIVPRNGFVNSGPEKSRAGSLARGVNGVVEVRNNLNVRGGSTSMGTAMDDTVITGKVTTALIGTPQTKAREIHVETRAGVMQLSGFVDNATQKRAAGPAHRRQPRCGRGQSSAALRPYPGSLRSVEGRGRETGGRMVPRAA